MDKDRERFKEPVCFADSAEEARAHVWVRDGEQAFVSSFEDTTITSAPPVESRKSRSTTTLSESAHMPGKGVLKKDACGGSRSANRRHTRGISSTSGRSKSPVQSWTSLVKREEDHKERVSECYRRFVHDVLLIFVAVQNLHQNAPSISLR
ncbi:hypothetical protein M427DRAFT_477432 [Gonapodya prolifera JEL478]|uniref:Uncharacterized protein n=1 Tax=Gonapodya prolifera (strain JEL478) TaxID=1344416 RepID=A0A139A153_GONPJ|nr:hypothetical protein M427DRAFT_477432 [Gonapodya prolifera JEL478]|eukprot:KXS10499.1 hypothetical protein M427DRAFT_477432 [Gonapodya prolifera JEL478]